MPAARSDSEWMKLALKAAQRSLPEDVPVGALVVREDTLLARGRNRREQRQDPTLHAEIDALRKAARKLGCWRLDDCTLFVTLEPCAMCAGAMILARVARVVFGAFDPKGGALGSTLTLQSTPGLNHRFVVQGGVLETDCAAILQGFFQSRRRS